MIKKSLAFFLAFAALAAPPLHAALSESDQQLKRAIQLCNQGQCREAAAILEKLAQEKPSDDRVFLSLGIAYRESGDPAGAIGAFERAVAIRGTPEGYYSLGLLYEAMALQGASGADQRQQWLKKAYSAWDNFLRLNPQDTRRSEVALRHERQLKRELEGK